MLNLAIISDFNLSLREDWHLTCMRFRRGVLEELRILLHAAFFWGESGRIDRSMQTWGKIFLNLYCLSSLVVLQDIVRLLLDWD